MHIPRQISTLAILGGKLLSLIGHRPGCGELPVGLLEAVWLELRGDEKPDAPGNHFKTFLKSSAMIPVEHV